MINFDFFRSFIKFDKIQISHIFFILFPIIFVFFLFPPNQKSYQGQEAQTFCGGHCNYSNPFYKKREKNLKKISTTLQNNADIFQIVPNQIFQ